MRSAVRLDDAVELVKELIEVVADEDVKDHLVIVIERFTQFAGTQYQLSSLTQNGVPPGSFASVAMQTNGDVVVNYNNGQSRTIAQIPVVTFNSPDSLQSQNGQAFTATLTSGAPTANATNTNGAGTLVTNSVEGSNVDIAAEFSKLIVAQRAYSANAKMVTTADDMLTQTIDMKR